jgi:molybdopterin-guanine dinucleotide biosynthesis protein MobB
MSQAVFVFAAYANTGKTTYLCGLVAALKAKGLRVAVIKDSHHAPLLDRPGSDSDRLRAAGADAVGILADERSALLWPGRVPLADMLAQLDADIVLLEGFKGACYPQIGLYRVAADQPLPAPPESYMALVTDTPFAASLPQFPLDDPAPLAQFLMAQAGLGEKQTTP